ncbi:hypothetical protein SAMN05421805_13234 [Saccharopolyspora antimicrobica]|uniref:Uncharacterized protein n=1 Tax=Saccharopolyspora antimicrobica TaxID=455193 RepID=A0A1I5LQS0_9PSEU|nr:hypothetical protein [Saccharopolyspora antimicrobica]RKT87872.1 hypothetical protein ATL45_6294 [Saccharopolyspora antimicrobica]SFO99562.1 hypothetical protein SAMN05421805_13234 [Saccharopolyspora antimicrobica]
MDEIPRQQVGSDLPSVLAEYGHLAAQLPSASRQRAEALRARLAELDELIDQHVARLSGLRETDPVSWS